MIRIPICFGCKNFNHESQACPAHPDGIPGEVLVDIERKKKQCSANISFEERYIKPNT